METGGLFEWESYALVKIIQRVLDKNQEKHLASFEALRATPPVLTSSLRA